ncbi:MAG: TIGR00341 family protein [Spirochaetia bacterium]|nr:TIGR00341 family protein [Spirochaetia bacterium]
MEKEKKANIKNDDKKKLYESPGFFKFLSDSIFKKKSSQNPEIREENIYRKITGVFDEYNNIKKNHERNISTYELIFESSKLGNEFFVLLIGSSLIASFGLLQNSAAVIIGAMIIAPLMTPILGFALGSLWGDYKLMGKSSLTLFVGIVTAVTLSSIIGFIMPGIEMNSEILARTNPSLYDIVIALASGFVGSYAFVNPRISSSISGVAIAVALVPPLAVTGICIGTFQWHHSIGSFLLFASNLVSISLAASFVFWRMKVQPYMPDTGEINERAKRKFLLSSVVLILIAIPLGYFMKEVFYIKKQTTEVENMIKKDLPSDEITTHLNKYYKTYHLECKIISPKEADLALKEKIKSDIKTLFEAPVEIKLIIIKSL